MLEKYIGIRKHTEKICKPLKTEDYIPQLVEYASPPKWHLAHTTWFFETMILDKYKANYKVFHPKFSFLFNSYYNTIGQRAVRNSRGHITRPTVNEVYEYRAYVDQQMTDFISEGLADKIKPLIELGLQHEQQHQELLITDLKYTLGYNPIFPEYSSNFDLTDDINSNNDWIKIPEGIYEIGYDSNGFSFDNEHTKHKVFLHEYEISTALITNKEYIEFINDGGYQKFEFWLDEGWHWVNNNEIQNPLYWHKIEEEWHQYTLAGLKKVNPDAMLTHISFYEANAFACWKNLRLPTEFEWEIASSQLDWGKRWEWTSSAYLPYPNFKIGEGAIGEYNGKFMVNQMVLRGASRATSLGHSRKTYRNFFHPHFQWQYTGIRLAK